jgi:hypothetical protein
VFEWSQGKLGFSGDLVCEIDNEYLLLQKF